MSNQLSHPFQLVSARLTVIQDGMAGGQMVSLLLLFAETESYYLWARAQLPISIMACFQWHEIMYFG